MLIYTIKNYIHVMFDFSNFYWSSFHLWFLT